MNSKFFTNQQENTLLKKIEGVFQYKSIYFLDILVGYFYASGYFRIRKYIEKASKIRILVGIDVDTLVKIASYEGLQFNQDKDTTREEFLKKLKRDIQSAEYAKEIEEGILNLIQDLVDERIQIKIHPNKNIHAKLYIFREKNKHEHGYGVVITGSSNLTQAGLEKNFEINVELRDNPDIDFATDTFDKLWDEAVELDLSDLNELKKDTYLNDQFTPFEVYMKFLIEYFGSSVNYDPNSITDLPKGFQRLAYQIDAVNDGFKKLVKHNGFFLADVVGLGKTIVSLIIAKKFYFYNGFPSYRSNTLIVCPPAIKDNWKETKEKFQLDNCDIITNGSLHKVKHPEKYDLIIVDEAHKFRSDTAEMYNRLQIVCKTPTRKILPNGERVKKKVVLVSATPLNNKPEDIANQIYLFQDSRSSTLEISNLQSFFRKHIDRYNKLKKEPDIEFVKNEVKKIYESIRTKVLEQLIVRRTRTDLKEHSQYANDLKEQKIEFPQVKKPIKALYKLDEQLESLYDKTMFALSDPDKGLTYNRYRAIGYLKPEKKKKYRSADLISSQLAKIMKTLLVKRIDSSFYAFTQSLRRFKEANDAMVKMFENGKIYIAPNLNVTEYILEDREDDLIEEIVRQSETDPTIEICEPFDFKNGFIEGLLNDQKILNELYDFWIQNDKDPKFDKFLELVNNELLSEEINDKKKLIVFSESKETTDYLLNRLKENNIQKILAVNSQNRNEKANVIRANFDANIPEIEKRDDYHILISTEVLSEGINLHQANVIVNYDTPWNSTRLMQRIGRVNRIGSESKFIYVYNFFPTANVDNDIELQKKAIMKLHAFHNALGEDSQIYSPDEEISTFGLFDKEMEEERDESLIYLMRLRKFKEENPEKFKLIKNMPLRSRVGRKAKTLKDTTLCFIRNSKRDAFYFCKENELEELTFLECARVFEATFAERAVDLHKLHHEQVQTAVKDFAHKIEEEKARELKVDLSKGPNERKALEFLNAFENLSITSKNEKEQIRLAKRAIGIGKFQNLHRDINKLERANKKTPVKPVILLEKLIHILSKYKLELVKEDTLQEEQLKFDYSELNPEIIISESFS